MNVRFEVRHDERPVLLIGWYDAPDSVVRMLLDPATHRQIADDLDGPGFTVPAGHHSDGLRLVFRRYGRAVPRYVDHAARVPDGDWREDYVCLTQAGQSIEAWRADPRFHESRMHFQARAGPREIEAAWRTGDPVLGRLC